MQPISQKHFPWLDLLRFLAAFLVLAGHYRGGSFVMYADLPVENQNIVTMIFFSLTCLGHEAVVIFFVLSGFLVGGRALERMMNNTFNSTDYCIDRFTRIMLPLVSALLLLIPVSYYVSGHLNWIAWLGNLLSLQWVYVPSVSDPLWSLNYEVWFYVLMLGVILILSRPQGWKKGVGMAMIVWVMIMFASLKPIYMLFWFVGAFAYLCRPKNDISRCKSYIYIYIYI